MIAVIDNYDSFTYNLVQYFFEFVSDVKVFRNDKVTIGELESLAPSHIVISPGPGTPYDGGISMETIRHFAGKTPLFGVCLGHQCIVEVFGGKVVRAPRLMHGKTSEIIHDCEGVFRGIPNPFTATRYHSLIADPSTIPPELVVTAHTGENEIMGVRHRDFAVEGVQFHPESILTAHGKTIICNFLSQ